jgi:ketosteroid isomerase-like protein
VSRENVDVVVRLYNDCWAAANLDLVPEVLHPDIVWTAIESAPDAGTRRGHAETRAYMEDWLEGFDLGAMPVEPVGASSEGHLVCSLRGTGTERRSGLTTEIRYGGVFRFAGDGRIVEIHEYATVDAALEAVGLRE